MAKTGMLGMTSLSAWQRLRNDLENKIAGHNGTDWLNALNALSRFGARRFLESYQNVPTDSFVALIELENVVLCKFSKRLFAGEAGIIRKGKLGDKNVFTSDISLLSTRHKIIFDSTQDLETTMSHLISDQLASEKGNVKLKKFLRFYVLFKGEIRKIELCWDQHKKYWEVSTNTPSNFEGFIRIYELS